MTRARWRTWRGGRCAAAGPALAEALDGLFDSHHGVIAQMLLGQVAFLDQQSTQMEEQAIAALARGACSPGGRMPTGETGPGCGTSVGLVGAGRREPAGRDPRRQTCGCAVVIIAEIGLDMSCVPHPGRTWCPGWGLCRSSSAQSGTRTGKGNAQEGQQLRPRRGLGEAVPVPPCTATFLGRAVLGGSPAAAASAIAQTAVARSIMIIAWHLLIDPAARYRDLGPDYHARPRQPGQEDHQLPPAACTPSASPSPSPPTTRPPRHPPPAPAGLWPGPEPPPRPGPRPARPGAGPLPRSGRAGFTWSDDGLSRERCLQDLDGGGCHLISGGS